MRFPLKKLLPIVAAICLLGLLIIGNLKPLNNKEDSGTANNVANSHLARVVLDLDSESGASQENKNETHRKFLIVKHFI